MYMQDTAHPLRGQPWTEIATLIAMQDPTLTEFQQFIRDRYHETDSARGPARTFRGDGDDANLREEFADVLAWLGTLANITGVDLAEAVHEKYVADGGPAGTK